LERLAPFGAGNPALVLATRGVRLKSVTEIGKTKEHLRLTVEDNDGNSQGILWWGGAGEELPPQDGSFDIAYSLRASTFRGGKQVNLTFEEFRVAQGKTVEIHPALLEVVDLRSRSSTHNLEPSTLIWAEGADREKGKSRLELSQADELAIYTTPASPADLRSAMETVKPKKVYVLGVSPSAESTDGFLTRLAGMTKYVINNKGGRISASELAAATAQRESAVRIGLEWLSAGGHMSLIREGETFLLSAGNGEANQYLQKELFIAVRGILEETTAYRAYFSGAEVKHLLGE
jgi:single-stranded-DNA-specific exonuclease